MFGNEQRCEPLSKKIKREEDAVQTARSSDPVMDSISWEKFPPQQWKRPVASIIIDDMVFVILQFCQSNFAINVCSLVCKQWREQSLKINLSLELNDRLLKYRMKLMTNSSYLQNMTHLNLTNNAIGDASSIAKCPKLNRLTYLNLSRNLIGWEGGKAIAESEYMMNLTHLDVSSNCLFMKGAQFIANSRYMNKLVHLNLCRCDIRRKDIDVIADSEHLSNLTFLNLGDNFITSIAHVQEVALKFVHVSELRICNSGLCKTECQQLEKQFPALFLEK